jgi:hypothetical protein
MSIITKAPIQLLNISTAPATPATGNVVLYSLAGVLSLKDDSGNVIAFTNSGHSIVNGAGTATTQRPAVQFIGATVSDDSTNQRSVVTITGAEAEAVDFTAGEFSGDVLTIAAASMGISYDKVLVQVFDEDGNQVLCGVNVDGTSKDIAIHATAFDGTALISKVA